MDVITWELRQGRLKAATMTVVCRNPFVCQRVEEYYQDAVMRLGTFFQAYARPRRLLVPAKDGDDWGRIYWGWRQRPFGPVTIGRKEVIFFLAGVAVNPKEPILKEGVVVFPDESPASISRALLLNPDPAELDQFLGFPHWPRYRRGSMLVEVS